jgi:hypothetical protein
VLPKKKRPLPHSSTHSTNAFLQWEKLLLSFIPKIGNTFLFIPSLMLNFQSCIQCFLGLWACKTI